MKITITEALSEINLIKKKIESTQNFVTGALVRAEHLPDPFVKEGGTPELIKRNLQSLRDLHRILEGIRSAVSQANLDNKITIGETTKSVYDWLTWKREISEGYKTFVQTVYNTTKTELDRNSRQPQVWQDDAGVKHLLKVVPNVDLGDWLRATEMNNELIEKLDGQLSLKNATILVEV